MIITSEWQAGTELHDAFLSLPEGIYHDFPLWPGENRVTLNAKFSNDNPWLEQGKAWTGVIPGQARLAGFIPYHLVSGQKTAFFGFWETINYLSCNEQLFDALATWAKQYGITQLYGPVNFSTFGQYRIRLNQFKTPPFVGEPYNPPYYATLLEQIGFSVKHHYTSTFTDVETAADNWERHHRKMEKLPMPQITIQPLTPAVWMREQRRLYEFIDSLFGNSFAYTPLTWDEFQQRYGVDFIQHFCPYSSMLAQTKDGGIAGVSIILPISCDGKAEANLCKTLAIHPRYRRTGVLSRLFDQFFHYTRQHYPRIGGAMMRDDNTSLLISRSLLKGADQHHYYALYGKELFR